VEGDKIFQYISARNAEYDGDVSQEGLTLYNCLAAADAG
jgi:hypothetical protein